MTRRRKKEHIPLIKKKIPASKPINTKQLAKEDTTATTSSKDKDQFIESKKKFSEKDEISTQVETLKDTASKQENSMKLEFQRPGNKHNKVNLSSQSNGLVLKGHNNAGISCSFTELNNRAEEMSSENKKESCSSENSTGLKAFLNSSPKSSSHESIFKTVGTHSELTAVTHNKKPCDTAENQKDLKVAEMETVKSKKRRAKTRIAPKLKGPPSKAKKSNAPSFLTPPESDADESMNKVDLCIKKPDKAALNVKKVQVSMTDDVDLPSKPVELSTVSTATTSTSLMPCIIDSTSNTTNENETPCDATIDLSCQIKDSESSPSKSLQVDCKVTNSQEVVVPNGSSRQSLVLTSASQKIVTQSNSNIVLLPPEKKGKRKKSKNQEALDKKRKASKRHSEKLKEVKEKGLNKWPETDFNCATFSDAVHCNPPKDKAKQLGIKKVESERAKKIETYKKKFEETNSKNKNQPLKTSSAPQVHVNSNGDFVIDTESLQQAPQEHIEYEHGLNDEITNQNSFRSRKVHRKSNWSKEDTDKFYLGIKYAGLDFKLMSSFYKHRDENELRRKYKHEHKKNPDRVDIAVQMNCLPGKPNLDEICLDDDDDEVDKDEKNEVTSDNMISAPMPLSNEKKPRSITQHEQKKNFFKKPKLL